MGDLTKQLIVLCRELIGEDVFDRYKTNYETRLHVQKAIYLFQELTGVNMGYYFSWYIAGPYSPSLTSTIYNDILNRLEEDPNYGQIAKLNTKGQVAVDNVVAFVSTPPKELNLTTAKWWELIASIHYLKKQRTLNDENLAQELRLSKPYFSEEHIDAALSHYNKSIEKSVIYGNLGSE